MKLKAIVRNSNIEKPTLQQFKEEFAEIEYNLDNCFMDYDTKILFEQQRGALLNHIILTEQLHAKLN